MNATKISASPAKLRSGAWGARVKGIASAGDVITITTRAGKSWDARVARVVWRGDGISLCATEKLGSYSPSLAMAVGATAARASARYERRGARSHGRRTGCSCGSRENRHGDLIPSASNCWQCEHDA